LSTETNHVVQISYVGSGRCEHEAYTKASNMTTPLVVDECRVEDY
jgi:hypothetical protein